MHMYTFSRILNQTLFSKDNVNSNAPLLSVKKISWVLTLFLLLFIRSLNAQIAGKVFVDANQNGRFDVSEFLISGAQIKVYSYNTNSLIYPLQLITTSDPFGNFNIYPSSYPVKIELVLDPHVFPLLPGKGYIQLPNRELYPFPGLIFTKPGSHLFALPVNISY